MIIGTSTCCPSMSVSVVLSCSRSGLPGADRIHQEHWYDCALDFKSAHYLDGFAHADGRFHFRPRWSELGLDHDQLPAMPDHYDVIDNADARHPFRLVAAPARQFLNRTFLRKLHGRDLPLYVFRTHLGLEQPNGTYAVLSFERGPANSVRDIRYFAGLTEELLASRRLDFTFEQPEEPEMMGESSGSPKEEIPF